MKLRPIFVDVLPEFDAIKPGDLLDQPQASNRQPALSLWLWGADGAIPPPQPVACLLRWEVGLPGRPYGWVRVDQFRLR